MMNENAADGEEERESLVVAIIDLNPSPQMIKDGECIVPKCLDALIAFCCSHVMLNPLNKLAIIGCHTRQSAFLYPLPSSSEFEDFRPSDGQYELFANIKNAVHTNVKKLVLQNNEEEIYTESLVAGAMTMALCYIHRLRKQHIIEKKIQARILIVSASGDSASQYMNFMNVFFTSQKEGVLIDACVIEKDSGLLQQGCDITGGMYLKIQNVSALLQYLLWIFLPNMETRKKMILPTRVHVDYRAACFCHRNLIEIGYVCSVCLSIFCTFSPICSTCQTAFKLGPLPTIIAKKRRKQASLRQ
ncbi:general transcription factor IIH subunit 3-like [Argiope bruennichi]|uniref:General transcription factor IIH subunit 3 n=1 Tax=Argiope bruennichi TaxID=94029 RepID=A0A8T0FXN3_ARGBR|nr:general transcription factor IIH subunit 3-like [Argiope bruennichi]KAF8793593.1 General transcription factor IIH subunit 3 like protein [Argiope bruennichi]